MELYDPCVAAKHSQAEHLASLVIVPFSPHNNTCRLASIYLNADVTSSSVHLIFSFDLPSECSLELHYVKRNHKAGYVNLS